MHKLSFLEGVDFLPHAYGNTYEIEQTTGPSRLVIAPASDHVALLLKLSRLLPEPFGILYVLLVSRKGNQPARYQCPRPCSRAEMESFIQEFREYFESDGRHHVWIASPESILVYDQHNVVYAYGPLNRFEEVLRKQGFKAGEVRFPSPHAHNYNPENDEEETRVLEYLQWIQTPLMEDDHL